MKIRKRRKSGKETLGKLEKEEKLGKENWIKKNWEVRQLRNEEIRKWIQLWKEDNWENKKNWGKIRVKKIKTRKSKEKKKTVKRRKSGKQENYEKKIERGRKLGKEENKVRKKGDEVTLITTNRTKNDK